MQLMSWGDILYTVLSNLCNWWTAAFKRKKKHINVKLPRKNSSSIWPFFARIDPAILGFLSKIIRSKRAATSLLEFFISKRSRNRFRWSWRLREWTDETVLHSHNRVSYLPADLIIELIMDSTLLRRDFLASTASVLTLPPSVGTCKKSRTISKVEFATWNLK